SVLGAPVKYSPAPEMKAAPEPAPQIEPAQRLTEILKSEPATETLLLTQVVANDAVEDEAGEIVTAHAKPVARSLDNVREATRVAFEAAEAKRRQRKRFFFFKAPELSNKFETAPQGVQVDRRLRAMRALGDQPRKQLPEWAPSFENIGLVALLVFGLALLALGGSLLFDGAGDLVSIAAAGALVAPGLAAALMAAFGLWRSQGDTATA
ncbi:MAG TPA: hypothetical protein VEF55_14345, partial [Candidatus Binatia bacterium]|nr:hypothetical protein [Candidatus Binatia bacterium]